MGEAVPMQCVPNAHSTYKHSRFSSEHEFMQVLEEGVQRKLKADCVVAASMAAVEPIEEEEEDEEVQGDEGGEEEEEERGSFTEELATAAEQVAMPWVLPVAPEFYVSGPGGKVAGHRSTA